LRGDEMFERGELFEGAGGGVDGGGHYYHEWMERNPGDHVVGDAHAGADSREDGEVERGVDGSVVEKGEFAYVGVEVAEHVAAGAHLFYAGTATKACPKGAVIGGGNGDKAADAGVAAKLLDVITGDESAHTEGNEVEFLAGGKCGSDEGIELPGHDIEREGGVVRLKADGVDAPTASLKEAFDPAHGARGIVDAVNQKEAPRIAWGKLRLRGEVDRTGVACKKNLKQSTKRDPKHAQRGMVHNHQAPQVKLRAPVWRHEKRGT